MCALFFKYFIFQMHSGKMKGSFFNLVQHEIQHKKAGFAQIRAHQNCLEGIAILIIFNSILLNKTRNALHVELI